MRILFLTPDFPIPPDQGAKLRSLALIRAAAEHHQVDVLSFVKNQGGRGSPREAALQPQCNRVRVVEAPPSRSLLRRSWSLLFDPLPDLAHRLESSAFRAALWEMLGGEQYDVVQIEGLEMMPYLDLVRAGTDGASIIYDAHNAEMSLQRSIFQVEFRDPRRWHGALYSLVQWSKLGTYERIMMNGADVVLAVSEGDAAKLRGRHVDPELVPNGVDTSAIPYLEPGRAPGSTLLFLGPLDYRPNADAVRWLLGDVFGLVRAQTPRARLRLVGRGTERIQGEGVDAAGYVEDVAAELAAADALVVPMRMGGGVRFKVLEGMAGGVPVVSTPLGLAGIAATDGQHALIGRTAAELASAVVRVLEDRALARRLGAAARRLAEARYDWKKITPHYLRLLTLARRRRRL